MVRMAPATFVETVPTIAPPASLDTVRASDSPEVLR
jgi:hypothetical protein